MLDKKAKEAKREAEALARARQRVREQREDAKDRTGIGLSSMPPRLDEHSQRPWGAKPVTVASVEEAERKEKERQELLKSLQDIDERAKARRAALEQLPRTREALLQAHAGMPPMTAQELGLKSSTDVVHDSRQSGNNDDLHERFVASQAALLAQAQTAQLPEQQPIAISPSRTCCAFWPNNHGMRAGIIMGGIGLTVAFLAGILELTNLNAITLQQVLTALGSKTLLSAGLASTPALFALSLAGVALVGVGLIVLSTAVLCKGENRLAAERLNIQQTQ